MIITIGCEYGSGGNHIGQRVADMLGIEFYDRDIVDSVVKKLGIDQELIEKADTADVMYAFETKLGTRYTNLSNKVITAQSEVIKKFAEETDCVIIGRCSDFFLQERDDVLNVFLYAPLDVRIKATMAKHSLIHADAEKLLTEKDDALMSRYKYITGRNRGDREGRQMILDSSVLGWEETAKYIVRLADLRFGKK